jgi:hypothetical protein
MTLIVTVISSLGIIQASDSNVTKGDVLYTGSKVFEIDFAHGALSISGRYGVKGRPIDLWMPECITDYATTTDPTIGGFAEHLRGRLEREVTDAEREEGMLIHVAGYAQNADGTRHPEMWFVRNLGMGSTGDYVNPGPFEIREDYWGRDHKEQPGPHTYRFYFNGYPPGRKVYLALHDALWAVFQGAWRQSGWRFREPGTIDELAAFVKAEFHALVALFISSNYIAPPIGGDIQLTAIAPPPGTVTL